jgi:hypothetical protein
VRGIGATFPPWFGNVHRLRRLPQCHQLTGDLFGRRGGVLLDAATFAQAAEPRFLAAGELVSSGFDLPDRDIQRFATEKMGDDFAVPHSL